MNCLKTITVKKWDKLTEEIIVQQLFLALGWEFGVQYGVWEYTEQSNIIYKSILTNTWDALNKPWTGTNWETYWVAVDNSIVELIDENYYVSERQDITNFTITFIVRLESTLDDPDDSTALFKKTAVNTGATQWKAEFNILETDNSTVGDYIYEIEMIDTTQPAAEQVTSNIDYWSYVIQEEATKD